MPDPTTVSTLSIVFMFVTVLICFGVPIGLAIWGKLKFKGAFSFIPLLFGILGFVISQILIRTPILNLVLPNFAWYQQLLKMQWLYVAFLSFTAGLVEEPARFAAFSILKKRRTFPDGFSYGIGHGGVEAILLVGITFINNLVLSSLINRGAAASVPGITSNMITSLTGTSPFLFLIAGLERIFAISLQIALSLVVLKGFQVNKKLLYLFIAFLIHGLVNFLALVFTNLGSSILPDSSLGTVLFAEGFLLIVAILSILFIVKQASVWRRSMQNPPSTTPLPQNVSS